MPLGSFDRSQNLAQLTRGTFDLVVVGGGVTGAGVALDAAARGLRTALVERDDFASGTSSRSSKMIHGGLRYLQNGDVRLVYEALRERQRLLRNAPHLVRVLPFLIPIFSGRDNIIPREVARALGSAMWTYDLTGGLRIGKLHRRLRRKAALDHMPTLREDRLAWAYLYYDAQADDARLTLSLARTAALDFGATVVNHARVRGFGKTGSPGGAAGRRIDRVLVEADGTELEVSARAVVNAAGVWSDDVRAWDEGTHPESIRPAKGIHITVPWRKVRNDIAAVIPVRKDRRAIFVVPWPDGDGQLGGEHGFTYIGTTDTDYRGDLDHPVCTSEDVDYLLNAVNAAIDEPLDRADVLGSWAGLRPLLRAGTSERTADLSRRHRVSVSEGGGLVSVTGGKLTTYREMAEDTVSVVVDRLESQGLRRLGRRGRSGRTSKLRLRGAEGWQDVAAREPHLAGRYGSEATVLEAMIEADPALAEPLIPGLPYRRAEALYAARYEMATTLSDILDRRTRARLLARDAAAAHCAEVADLVGDELGWSTRDRQAEVAAYRQAIEEERAAPGLPETGLPEAGFLGTEAGRPPPTRPEDRLAQEPRPVATET